MKKNNDGFTFIEMIIVITILSIITVIAAHLLNAGFRVYLYNKNFNHINAQGSFALTRMSRDLYAAQSLTIANNSQLQYIDDADKTITYALSGTTLTQNKQPLANNVGSLTFSYLDANEMTTDVLNKIYYVSISLEITFENQTKVFQTVIHPRNII